MQPGQLGCELLIESFLLELSDSSDYCTFYTTGKWCAVGVVTRSRAGSEFGPQTESQNYANLRSDPREAANPQAGPEPT